MDRGRPRKVDPDAALDTAMRVFWDQGFEGTSMNDLVAATGMAKPGLYANFGCKEQLYVKALTHYLERSAPMFKELVTSTDALHVVLKRFLDSIRDGVIDKTCPTGCFVVNSVVECANKTPKLKDVSRNLNDVRRAALLARFQMEKKTGGLPADTDVNALTNFFNGQCVALAVLGRGGSSRISLNQLISLSLKIL